MSIARMHRGQRARKLAWLVLITAVTLLILAQAGAMSPVLDVISHLTGHLLGAAASAVLALAIGRIYITVLALGLIATLAGHVLLALPSRDINAVKLIPGHQAVSTTGNEAANGAGRGSITAAQASQPKQIGPANRTSPTSNAPPLKIISLNSWHSNKAPEKIIAYLREQNADVVVLIEFGPSKLGLLRALAQLGYRHQVHCATRWYCSLAMVSRKPLLQARTRSPTGNRPALIWARIGGMAATGAAAGGAADGDPVSNDSVTIIGTHVYRPSAKPRLHATHLKHLAKFVATIKGPKIVVGDFNATPWSHSFKQFARDTGLVPSGSMLPSWPAWPAPLPQFAIDHMFVSNEITVRARGIGAYVGSDHLPIWAQIDVQTPLRP